MKARVFSMAVMWCVGVLVAYVLVADLAGFPRHFESGIPPRAERWPTLLTALAATGLAGIALAFFGLAYVMRWTREVEALNGVRWLFRAFLVACGAQNAVDCLTLWYPHHYASVALTQVTAWVAVVSLVYLVSKLRSYRDLSEFLVGVAQEMGVLASALTPDQLAAHKSIQRVRQSLSRLAGGVS